MILVISQKPSLPRARRPTTRLPKSRKAIDRHVIRPSKAVPPGGADFVVGPLRHDEVMPQQDTIERPRRGHKFVAVGGEDDMIDQCVDSLVGNADQIARAGSVCGM